MRQGGGHTRCPRLQASDMDPRLAAMVNRALDVEPSTRRSA